MRWVFGLTALEVNPIPRARLVSILQLGERRDVGKHEPIGVSGTDAEAESRCEVHPETFPEFSGDWCDGHLVSGGGMDGCGGLLGRVREPGG